MATTVFRINNEYWQCTDDVDVADFAPESRHKISLGGGTQHGDYTVIKARRPDSAISPIEGRLPSEARVIEIYHSAVSYGDECANWKILQKVDILDGIVPSAS